MSTCLVSRTSTLLEVIQFVGDLMLLTLGCSPLSRLAKPIYRIAKTLTWAAELTLLAIALALSVTGDMALTVGHHLGRCRS